MTAPQGAQTAGDGTRLYPIQGADYPSANTVLGKLDRPGLNIWKLKRVAAAVAVDPELRDLAEQGKEYVAAMRALDGDSWESMVGTAVHLATEVFDMGLSFDKAMSAVANEFDADVVEVVEPHLDQWVQARLDYVFVPVIVEKTVCNPEIGYAGTADRFMATEDCQIADLIHPGCRKAHCLDVKTGKSVYPDTAMQLAAYANATDIWDPQTDTLSPMIDACTEVGIVAALHADECRIIPMSLPHAWATFVAATIVWQWSSEYSKLVIQPTLDRPSEGLAW